MLIDEGVNSNQRVQLQKQDKSFYAKLQKQFKQSSQTFKVVPGEHDLVSQRRDPKIEMKPLNQMIIPKEQEKLLDSRQPSARDVPSFDARWAQNESALQNSVLQCEEHELENILTGQPARAVIDLGYVHTVLKKVQSSLLRDLSVRSIKLNDSQNAKTIAMYQRPLHRFVYELRSIQDPRLQDYKNWAKTMQGFTLGQVAGQSLATKAVNMVGQSIQS